MRTLSHRIVVAGTAGIAAVGALAGTATRVHAQVAGQLSVSGGTATDQRGQRSNALSVAPAFSFLPSPRVALHAGGSATRFATQAWSLGAHGALDAREAAGPVTFTLHGAVNASQLQDGGSAQFMQGEVIPAVELRIARVLAFGGVRAAGGAMSQQVRTAPALPGTGGGTRSLRESRSGAGLLYGVTLSLASHATYAVTLGAREDRMRIAGLNVADRSLALTLSHPRLAASAAVGTRVAPDERLTVRNLSLSVPIAPAVALDVAAGRYASNRLLGTPAGDYATAGLTFRFGGRPAQERPLPDPAGIPAPARGTTRLSIRAPDARTVEIAGDFNEWAPTPALRASNGVWYADLRIAPGRYRYAFRVDGSAWRVPDGATAVDDGFGGKSAWLSVGEPGSRQ